MPQLISIDDFDNFKEVLDFPPEIITDELVKVVKELDEKEELEPYIRQILFDSSSTPHGPAEIVDIFTHKVSVKMNSGLAAFILKGKSFQRVRHRDVAHQIYRIEKIDGLKFAIFAASGDILDDAKEHFCATAERLDCQYAIFDAIDLARLFVAHGYLCPRDARKIVAGRCKCGYSPKKRILNVLQQDSLKALSLAHKLGQQTGLIVLPPGSGKTRIAAEDAKKFNAKHVLYVAHTHEILDVAQSEFEAVFTAAEVSRHTDISSLNSLNKVNIVTIQLLRKHLETVDLGPVDYLVVDEFHRAAAKSYRNLLIEADQAFLLGLTATPFRGDRQDIFELCGQNLLINFELRAGIEMGILCPYHYFGYFDDIDYSTIRHNGITYDVRDLERALIIPERDTAIIRAWKERAEEKPTLAFCCSHRHAKRVVTSFQKNGVSAEVYLSTTKLSKRDELIEKFKNGDISVLVVVDVMNEGADLPFVECLLFLRPTESKLIFYQQLGRGLRRYVGKSHCIVIDFIGNFKNAYKIVDFQGLLPHTEDETLAAFSRIINAKEVFNLPYGCDVHFDERVIDVFANQTLDPRRATRHNIGRILLYQYLRLSERLEKNPSSTDVDRNLTLGSNFYKTVFGSWKKFEEIVSDETKLRKHFFRS